jgi:hypothetical protein
MTPIRDEEMVFSTGDEVEMHAVEDALKSLGERGQKISTRLMILQGNQPPWQSSGTAIRRGQSYSLFAHGRIHWSTRHPHLHGGPQFHLWARVAPGGRAVNLSAATGTFKADVDGTVELGIYMGMWADEFGNLKSDRNLYAALHGSISAVIAVYDDEPSKLLESVINGSVGAVPTPIVAETARLRRGYKPPGGWHYLHEAGNASIYTVTDRQIHAHAENDQGILRKSVSFPLSATTELQWRWRIDEHPSHEPEDRALSHDYVSIATEFDNGRDLTWIWSSCLVPGTHFQCPVKAWRDRETHYVVRSAGDTCGKWYAESRNVFLDVTQTMGAAPRNITAVWLIVLSTFNHRVARASFADISLVDEDSSVTIL